MKKNILFFLTLIITNLGYSQEPIYLLFNDKDSHFNQVFNIEVGEDYLDSVFSFKISKKLNKKHKNLEEGIKDSFNWGTRRLSFVHNKYNDSIVVNNKWLKEDFILDFEYLSGYKWVTSKNVEELSMNSLYLLMKEKLLEKYEENSEDYKRLTSPIPKLYKLDNLYYDKYKFYNYQIVKGSLNKKDVDVINLNKYKCYNKFVKLRKRLLKADKIYIIKKENKETHLYEVALLKKIRIY